MIIKQYIKLKLVALIVITSLLSGCFGPMVNVSVDSISMSTYKKAKNKYFLLPGNKDCSISDLQFNEFAAYTDKVLQNEGFAKVTKLDDADIAILLTYGISDPQVYQYSYSVPILGQTGIASSNTQGSVNTFGKTAIYSQSTSYTPSYGIVGSSTKVRTGILYARHLALSGYDLENFKKTRELKDVVEVWSTKASSVGESGDLRRIFPVLLAASQEYIAINTGKNIDCELRESDKRVLKLLKEEES